MSERRNPTPLRVEILQASTSAQVDLLVDEGMRKFIHADAKTKKSWKRAAAKRKLELERR